MDDKDMIAYLVRLFIERALGLLLFLLGSGWTLGPRGALWHTSYDLRYCCVLARSVKYRFVSYFIPTQ